jgi:uncharacterized MAPEG superfamily protein
MTTALWCVLIGIVLPYLWTGMAKSLGRYRPRDNHQPREFLEQLEGPAKRAHWAQLNSFEAFPAFAAAVLVAQWAHATQVDINRLAMVWVVARVAYGAFYVADLALLRSLAWLVGMICVVGLFIVAA